MNSSSSLYVRLEYQIQTNIRHAPANRPRIRHIAFGVKDIDAVVAGLRARRAELVGELERYEDSCWSAMSGARTKSSS